MKKVIMAVMAVWVLCLAAPAAVQAAGQVENVSGALDSGGTASEIKTGTLGIVKTDEEDKEKRLPGAAFSIYEAGTGRKAGGLLTGEGGKAVMELPAGDYILREDAAPDGYLLSTEDISISLQAGEVWEIVMAGRRVELRIDTGKAPEDVGNGENTGTMDIGSPGKSMEEKAGQAVGTEKGILLVVNAGEGTGVKLSGAVFTVYSSAGRKAGVISVREGEARLALPPGDYYLQEKEAPEGYQLEAARIAFTVLAGETTLAEVTSEKDRNYFAQNDIPQTGKPDFLFPCLAVMLYMGITVLGMSFLWPGKRAGKENHAADYM